MSFYLKIATYQSIRQDLVRLELFVRELRLTPNVLTDRVQKLLFLIYRRTHDSKILLRHDGFECLIERRIPVSEQNNSHIVFTWMKIRSFR
ncbi:UNVERIFIED_CONTAM: hypothetical protein NCL1_33691 [Trichonephila clavipes]